MGLLNVQKIGMSGTSPTFSPISESGDQFPFPGTKLIVHIRNKSTADDLTVTVKSQRPCDQGVLHDLAIVIPASEEKLVELSNRPRFTDENGRVNVVYSGAVQEGEIAVYQV